MGTVSVIDSPAVRRRVVHSLRLSLSQPNVGDPAIKGGKGFNGRFE
jgi:hypothetical protein